MSQRLLEQLKHQGEVNRLMAEAGFSGTPLLSDDELKLLSLAFDAQVTPTEFVAHIIRDRRQSSPSGWVAA